MHNIIAFGLVALVALVQLIAAHCNVGEPCNGVCCGDGCPSGCQGLVCIHNVCQLNCTTAVTTTTVPVTVTTTVSTTVTNSTTILVPTTVSTTVTNSTTILVPTTVFTTVTNSTTILVPTTVPTTIVSTTTIPCQTTSVSSSTSSTSSPSTTPCATGVCFSTKFNSQSVPAGDVVWLSAVFKPKFSGSSASVSFTNSKVTINGVLVSPLPPDSFIQLQSNLQTCGTSQLSSGTTWQTTAPLPGSGNTFLSAVSIPVPNGVNWANAQVSWCGDISAPGEIDVQIAAAIYTSCSMGSANPESCETQTQYHAGVPTSCVNNLVPGGTGGGGSNFSGSLSATFPVCRP